MKTFLTFLLRLVVGLALAVLLVAGLFNLFLALIPTWGATPAEVARALPGDELVRTPAILWTNAVAIDAPPEEVWPWIAQIGDNRGGFYSYTFIENQVGALTGAVGYDIVYTNANSIQPQWQDPQPGDAIIQGSLKIREVQPRRYLLADSILPSPFLWIWVWYLEPAADGAQTRLLNRFAIEVPESAAGNPVMDFMLSVGGFVMQQNMLQSIQLRAEGGSEPAWLEMVEIALWLAALVTGLVAAGFYLFQRTWYWPLTVALLAVVVLFVLTFVQPSLWVRLLLDAGLVVGLVWSARKK